MLTIMRQIDSNNMNKNYKKKILFYRRRFPAQEICTQMILLGVRTHRYSTSVLFMISVSRARSLIINKWERCNKLNKNNIRMSPQCGQITKM